MCVVWVVVALAREPGDAQDAVPLVVAGELVREAPESIYIDDDGSLFDLDPQFFERSCEIVRSSLACEDFAVAFVSPPPAIPVAVALSALGPDLAVRLVRLGGALASALGMVTIWRRLAPRSARAPALVALTAVAITPLVLIAVGLGQTSPVMFALAAVGVVAWDVAGWRRVALAVVLVLVVALKLLPVLMLALLVLQRRAALVSLVVGGLVVLTAAGVAIGGSSVVDGFVTSSGPLEAQAAENPHNGSLDAAIYRAGGGRLAPDRASLLADALRVAVAPVLVAAAWRMSRDDCQWAFGWAAMVVLAPFAWWHYTLASTGAAAAALDAGPRTDRELAVLPALAIAGLPLSAAYLAGGTSPVLQWTWATGALGVVWWFGRPTSPQRLAAPEA